MSKWGKRGQCHLCLERRAWPVWSSQKCPLGGSRESAMEPGYPANSGLLPAPISLGYKDGEEGQGLWLSYVTTLRDRELGFHRTHWGLWLLVVTITLGGVLCLLLPPELRFPAFSPGTENKGLPSIPSFTSISLVRMAFLSGQDTVLSPSS